MTQIVHGPVVIQPAGQPFQNNQPVPPYGQQPYYAQPYNQPAAGYQQNTTTVVTHVSTVQPQTPQQWKNGLCGCMSNCSVCILGYFCPCVLFGQVAEKVGEDCCIAGLCFSLPLVNLFQWTVVRGKVRQRHNINGSCCSDLMCLSFCGFCSLIQMANEVDASAMARE